MDALSSLFREALGLGLDSKEIGLAQMAIRAAVVYVVTVAFVRLAKKRFMSRASAFDVILGIMLGSIVSRAITGNAPFGPALAASAALIAMHWLFSFVAYYWHGFGIAVKGQPRVLIRDGAPDRNAMRRAHTEHDLHEDLRTEGLDSPVKVREARLERSGKLSVVKRSDPKIVEVKVEGGVQVVRLEIA
ncbi:MAG TPA: YetF domain-containing protein [Beijerinckiaceae bacterium]|jgi:uncharacterized membrane protein YcaP (DUF421 family)|nr:YetF domain-containing protein [Beijerinckiaceae bacterium]